MGKQQLYPIGRLPRELPAHRPVKEGTVMVEPPEKIRGQDHGEIQE
jgi:hypothetical protein